MKTAKIITDDKRVISVRYEITENKKIRVDAYMVDEEFQTTEDFMVFLMALAQLHGGQVDELEVA